MKTILIVILSAILLTSCSSDEISIAEQRKIQKEISEQQTYLREQNRQQVELQRQQDSLIAATIEQKKQSLKDSVQIIKAYTSNPNSVGGVDLTIVWKNKTKRVVKYANFRVSAINAVGDEVRSEIAHYGTAVVTGPIKPNSVYGYGKYWPCMWYNSTIKKCVIKSVELEFFDGTTLEITL
jgi:uncharacterized protein YjhX (UPF0386 family)